MNATAEALEKREKMSTIKKINEGILQTVKRIRFRSVGAVLLGGCAGLSLTSSVIPMVMETFGFGDSFSTRWALAGYAVYAMMAWGVGGWAARRIGNPLAGSIILGLVGMVSGLVLTLASLGNTMNILLAGGGAGMIYGGIGGLLIATTLAGERQPPPGEGTTKNTGNPHRNAPPRKDSARFFRFFN